MASAKNKSKNRQEKYKTHPAIAEANKKRRQEKAQKRIEYLKNRKNKNALIAQ